MRSARLTLCRRFGPSPCPTHYDGPWATTPSADFCPITLVHCCAARCVGLWLHCLFRSLQSTATCSAWTLVNQCGPAGTFASTAHRHVGQISPNKNMRFRCTIAAFTLPLDTAGFVTLC